MLDQVKRPFFLDRTATSDTDSDISRPRLNREGTFLGEDRLEVRRRRPDHNRLGFAYQIAFVRILGRFPRHKPLETDEEILRYAALQLGTSPDGSHRCARRMAPDGLGTTPKRQTSSPGSSKARH